MSITPGNWSVGKTGGTVVSDKIPDNYTLSSGHDDTDYYGGFLIGESIQSSSDAIAMAAVPEMIEALKEAKRMYDKVQPAGGWQGVYDQIYNLIKKVDPDYKMKYFNG